VPRGEALLDGVDRASHVVARLHDVRADALRLQGVALVEPALAHDQRLICSRSHSWFSLSVLIVSRGAGSTRSSFFLPTNASAPATAASSTPTISADAHSGITVPSTRTRAASRTRLA